MEEWLNALIEGKVITKETTHNLSKVNLLLHKAVQFVQYEQKIGNIIDIQKEMRSFYLYKSNFIYYSKLFII